MNKKAFTTTELLAVVVILGVLLMIAVPSYSSYVNKTKEEVYKAYEKAMEDAAKTYVTECIYKNRCADGSSNVPAEITLSTLDTNDYIEEISTGDCDSTASKVTISGDTYTVELVCDGYTTP